MPNRWQHVDLQPGPQLDRLLALGIVRDVRDILFNDALGVMVVVGVLLAVLAAGPEHEDAWVYEPLQRARKGM